MTSDIKSKALNRLFVVLHDVTLLPYDVCGDNSNVSIVEFL